MRLGNLKNTVKEIIPRSVRQAYKPRTLNVICVGTPKSGTTSIAKIFSTNFRHEHEAERPEHVTTILSHYNGKMTDDDYVHYLKKRDRRLWLDLESNCFLGYRVDLVYKAFPNAKYLLTLRHPLSWLDSIFDNNINYRAIGNNTMAKWHNFFFKPELFKYELQEQILRDNNLYPITAYLNYWLEFNTHIIQSIPAQQQLILQTQEISNSFGKISDFLNTPKEKLSIQKSLANKTKNKHGILKQLDQSYVQEKIEDICGDFIRQQGLVCN